MGGAEVYAQFRFMHSELSVMWKLLDYLGYLLFAWSRSFPRNPQPVWLGFIFVSHAGWSLVLALARECFADQAAGGSVVLLAGYRQSEPRPCTSAVCNQCPQLCRAVSLAELGRGTGLLGLPECPQGEKGLLAAWASLCRPQRCPRPLSPV